MTRTVSIRLSRYSGFPGLSGGPGKDRGSAGERGNRRPDPRGAFRCVEPNTIGDPPVTIGADGEIVDGILSGLGAYNMKGGVAAAAEALAEAEAQ